MKKYTSIYTMYTNKKKKYIYIYIYIHVYIQKSIHGRLLITELT